MKQTGTILRIEKISLNDGQGMRTVVFFKGCPLHCAWCSTPESQRSTPEVYYQAQHCVRCGRCINACPQHALAADPETGFIVRNTSACTNCFSCVNACHAKAQRIYGKEMTLKEIMRQIQRDEVFFFHSGGGVTLSGGDLLLQADFAQSILIECKESGINTAAEMDMFGEYDRIAMLLPYLDRFYVDVKLMDPEQHERWTGVSNETILRNIRQASAECRQNALHVRVPLIPGVSDSQENILQTVDFCRSLSNFAGLEFLPYHRLGQATYDYLGRDYTFRELPTLTAEDAIKQLSFLSDYSHSFPILVAGRPLHS